MERPALRILDLAGSPGEMGLAHGRTHADEIRAYAADRVTLAGSPRWSGSEIDAGAVLEIARSCLPAHASHSPSLHEEMCALADGAGITPEEAVIVGGFTDFVDTVRAAAGGTHPEEVTEDDCTAFIVPDELASGSGFLGQTWDMHDTATDHVVLLRIRPDDGPAALVFTTVGCLGQIGMNEVGVCVGINNLLAADGRPGVMWTSVVREALATATAEEARDTVLTADLAGGHSFLVFDSTGTGFVIEAMPTARPYTKLEGRPLVHTNHTVFPEASAVEVQLDDDIAANSTRRMERASKLLDRPEVTVDDLIAVTRDTEAICRTSTPPRHVESSGAVVMRPATGDFWAVWGMPSHNEYVYVPFQI